MARRRNPWHLSADPTAHEVMVSYLDPHDRDMIHVDVLDPAEARQLADDLVHADHPALANDAGFHAPVKARDLAQLVDNLRDMADAAERNLSRPTTLRLVVS